MSCSNNCNNNTSNAINLGNLARQNNKAHETVLLGDFSKITLMSVDRRDELGAEVHKDEDQLITVAGGTAFVTMGRTCNTMNCTSRLNMGDSIFIPAGMWHNVRNVGNSALKLYSVYSMCRSNEDNSNGCGCGATNFDGSQNTFAANLQRWNNDDDDCGCGHDSGC